MLAYKENGLETLVTHITQWITTSIMHLGYPGIIVMMGMESACIPLPSEVIMPVGGYLASISHGQYTFWGMGLAGAFGEMCGSTVAYWAGKLGGRPFIGKYGKYILIRPGDLDKADLWFKKHGEAAVFFGRLMPVIRTFISFPAGVSRMRYGRFIIYTIAGSLPWCMGLAWLGREFGARWAKVLEPYFQKAHVIVAVAVVALIALYIYHHVRGGKRYSEGK